jgi:energy-coupling factor transport system ATP-binding protein
LGDQVKAVLTLENVSFSYPQSRVRALSGLTLRLFPGEVLYCAGPSGCGKSTLLRVLNGLARHHFKGRLEGAALVNGRDNREKSLLEISREIGTLFQNPQYFALTPKDEFLLGLECQGYSESTAKERLTFWSERLNLASLLNQPFHTLSIGEKQKAVLSGLLGLAPGILLLDEPTANLDQAAAAELSEHLRRISREGMAIIIADHRRHWLGDWVDRAVILDRGRLVWEGAFKALDDPGLERKWGLRGSGGRVEKPPVPASISGRSAVSLRDLSFAFRGRKSDIFKNFSAEFPKGRVVALVGPNGSGKTTLMRLTAGLISQDSGRVAFGGRPLKAAQRLKSSSLALQNADSQLVMATVSAELRAALPRPAGREKLETELDFWGLTEVADRHPQSLSGGEKQRLVLACALARPYDFLALDEPSSGLDGRNMALVAAAVERAARPDASVLLITHDQELADLAADCELRLAGRAAGRTETRGGFHENPASLFQLDRQHQKSGRRNPGHAAGRS